MEIINGTSVGGMTLQADYSYTQNTSANTTTVTVTLKLANHYSLYASALSGSYISVGGNKTNYSKSISYGGSTTTTTTLATKTVTVTHNSDGTGSCAIGGTFVMNGSYRGSYIGTMSVSSTIILPKIARASELTVPSSVNTGSSLSGTITPSSTAFNHKVQLKIGSIIKDTISLAVGTKTFSYTVPHSWLPNSTSGTITVVLQTYNGASLVASVSKNVTANVPSNIAPSISWFGVNGTSNTLGGLYVQGKTTVQLSTSVVVGEGAGVVSYTYRGPDIYTTTESHTINTGTIQSYGTLTYTVSVKDTRGRIASASTQIYVYPYNTPTIGSVAVQRCTSDGTISDSGMYARYTVNSAYATVGGKNTRTVTVAFSSNNGSSYSSETTIQTTTDTNNSKTGTYGTGAFALASAYLIRFTIKDAYGATHSVTAPLNSVARPINIRSNGKGVAIGGMSTKDAFEVSMPADFNSSVNVDGALTVNGAFTHFGVGGLAKNITGQNLNTACGEKSGFYMGDNMTNAPSTRWWYIEHIVHNASYKVQVAHDFFSNTAMKRTCNAGTWNSWTQFVTSDHFANNFNQPGYTKLSNGLVLQWGLVTIPANTSGIDVKFPLVFPNQVRSVVCQNNYSNIRNAACSISSMSATGFKMTPYVTTTGSVPAVITYIYWMAMGY